MVGFSISYYAATPSPHPAPQISPCSSELEALGRVKLAHVMRGLPCWLSDEESICSSGDAGYIPGSGRCPGGGNGNPLQYSCLENPMDGGAWWAIIHGVGRNEQLSTYSCHAKSIRITTHYLNFFLSHMSRSAVSFNPSLIDIFSKTIPRF